MNCENCTIRARQVQKVQFVLSPLRMRGQGERVGRNRTFCTFCTRLDREWDE